MDMRTHEQIIGVRAEATDFKELHKVEKLAMDVTAYLYNVFEWPTSCNGREHAQ